MAVGLKIQILYIYRKTTRRMLDQVAYEPPWYVYFLNKERRWDNTPAFFAGVKVMVVMSSLLPLLSGIHLRRKFNG